MRRDGLKIALSGRTEEELLPVLQFVVRYVSFERQLVIVSWLQTVSSPLYFSVAIET